MRTRAIVILVLFLSVLTLMSFDPAKGVTFHKGSFQSVLFKAKQENKLILLDFYADWCAPCKIMEQSTFKDARLAQYLHENFITYKINIEDLDGIPYKNKYDIKLLPTLLVVDASGSEMKRFEEGMNSSKLLRKLQESFDLSKKEQVATQPEVEKPIFPSIKPDFEKTTSTGTVSFSSGLFEFDVTPHANSGYGVQIGTFGQYGNVLKEATKLKKKFSAKILVDITELNGKPVYRILVGDFNTRKDADDFKVYMENNNVFGYVVDFATL